jgi:hypothetical protein
MHADIRWDPAEGDGAAQSFVPLAGLETVSSSNPVPFIRGK